MNCPYCNTPIDKHEASRCLDTWVAEEVMGWVFHIHEPDEGGRKCKHCGLNESFIEFGKKWGDLIVPPYRYSTDIQFAWGLIEKLKGPSVGDSISWNWGIEIHWLEDVGVTAWHCNILHGEAEAPTAPLAICRAAIKAVNQ